MAEAQNGVQHQVPPHLRNAPTGLAKAMGHGDGYVWSQEMYDKYAKDHDGYGYDFDSEGNVACGVCNKTGIVSTDI